MELKINFKTALFTSRLLSWYEKNEEPHPWRLKYQKSGSPYYVWVSEIMLQQTVIKAVLPKYMDFFRKFPKVQDLARASESEVRLACAGLGYYRRFSFMHQAAKRIVQESGGRKINWPKSYSEWLSLPGIGSYSAAAISSITCGEAVPVVDGNVERVMCRIFDLRMPPNLPELKKAFFGVGLDLISQDQPGNYNQAIMELGQKVCRVNSPKCEICPVKSFCEARKKGSTDLAPAPKLKQEKIQTQTKVYVLHDSTNDRYALINRGSASRFLKNTEGFVSEHYIKQKSYHDFEGIHQLSKLKLLELGNFSHTITNHKMDVKVFKVGFNRRSKLPEVFKWYDSKKLDKNLISSFDKKILSVVRKSK